MENPPKFNGKPPHSHTYRGVPNVRAQGLTFAHPKVLGQMEDHVLPNTSPMEPPAASYI